MNHIKRVFQIKGAPNLLASGFFSGFASWIYVISMATLLYKDFGTMGVAVFGIIRQVPYIVLSPVAGFLIDKFPRKKLFLLINFMNVISMGVLVVFSIYNIKSIGLYFIVALIQVFVGTVDYPLRLSLSKSLVEKESLLEMNTISNIIGTSTLMLAPLAAGYLVGLSSLFWSFILNFTLYIFCLVLISIIPESANKVAYIAKNNNTLLSSIKDVAEGFSFIMRTKKLIYIAAILCIIHIAVGSIFIFAPYLSEVSNLGTSGIGYLLAMNGLGSFVGTLWGGKIGRNLTKTLIISLVGTFAACVICGFYTEYYWALFSVMLIGIFSTISEAPIMTAIQNETPEHASGRVFAALDVLIIGGMALGSFLVGWLLEITTFVNTLTIVGLFPLLTLFIFIKPVMNYTYGLSATPMDENISTTLK